MQSGQAVPRIHGHGRIFFSLERRKEKRRELQHTFCTQNVSCSFSMRAPIFATVALSFFATVSATLCTMGGETSGEMRTVPTVNSCATALQTEGGARACELAKAARSDVDAMKDRQRPPILHVPPPPPPHTHTHHHTYAPAKKKRLPKERGAPRGIPSLALGRLRHPVIQAAHTGDIRECTCVSRDTRFEVCVRVYVCMCVWVCVYARAVVRSKRHTQQSCTCTSLVCCNTKVIHTQSHYASNTVNAMKDGNVVDCCYAYLFCRLKAR